MLGYGVDITKLFSDSKVPICWSNLQSIEATPIIVIPIENALIRCSLNWRRAILPALSSLKRTLVSSNGATLKLTPSAMPTRASRCF